MKPWNLPNITIYTTKVQWVLRFIVIGQLIEVKHEITVIRPLSSLIDFVTSLINCKKTKKPFLANIEDLNFDILS